MKQKTIFYNAPLENFNAMKCCFEYLALLIPLILTIFTTSFFWSIALPIVAITLPVFCSLLYRFINGYCLNKKLSKILQKEQFKIIAIGMYIIPTFRDNANLENSQIKTSEEYLITIKIYFDFWNKKLKINGFTVINGEKSSIFSSTISHVQFEVDGSVKIRYEYLNDYIVTQNHKSNYIANFTGIGNLHFDNDGNLIDYYYSSDGKNRFSFLKKWRALNEKEGWKQ